MVAIVIDAAAVLYLRDNVLNKIQSYKSKHTKAWRCYW